MKCLLYEIEDDITIDNEYDEENLRLQLRSIKLFFEAMDRMGIKTINKEVYDCMMSMGYDMTLGNNLQQMMNYRSKNIVQGLNIGHIVIQIISNTESQKQKFHVTILAGILQNLYQRVYLQMEQLDQWSHTCAQVNAYSGICCNDRRK